MDYFSKFCKKLSIMTIKINQNTHKAAQTDCANPN